MELLEKIGESFNSFTAGIERGLTKVFGSSNERRIRQFGYTRDRQGASQVLPGSKLDRINSLEAEFEKLSNEELKQMTARFRERLSKGETLDDLLPEAFATVREGGRRFLKMRHYDVQMVGGYFLHQGMIAEMVTGEGKTLVATLPAYLNALAGKVHQITVNDYLALRDMEWMGPLYMGLGLTVGAIQSNMSAENRRKAYACDITYGTNNEFGFDYLRDNMKPTKELQAQGPLDFALIDEIDNILIDEARTPLIISGPAHDDVTKYARADRIARMLKKGEHFEVKEKEHLCPLTEEGVRFAEEQAGVESFYTVGNMEWPHLIDNSLRAHHLYTRDVNYVVQGQRGQEEIVIVDEFTGRLMTGRQWGDGLHQAVEAKEGVPIKAENQTLATITLQNYFKLYRKLAGMTGTAMTEASEFWKIYKLDVVSIPTNRPMSRINAPDVIYMTAEEKWDAVVEEIREVHETGRPVLVGTVSIETSELLSRKLNKYGVKHDVLNAKHHEREAEIIAQAGRKDAVTIATNMAGRGTDIILGGNPEHMAWEEVLSRKYSSRLEVSKQEWDDTTREIARREGMDSEGRVVAELGGLHVIGTERHDSRRIDLQLRGRAGRQGDPGSSRFFLSLEDKLMRVFAGDWVKSMLTRLGMQKGEAIESGMVTRRIEAAQKKVEETHFDQRKHLLEYDEVMDDQRKRVYSYRQEILDGAYCRKLIQGMIETQVAHWVPGFLASGYRNESVAAWAGQRFGVEITPTYIDGMTREQLEQYLRDQCEEHAGELIEEQLEENLPASVENERDWNWQALSVWANARYGLKTTDRELKKCGREEVGPHLNRLALEAISRYDFSDLDILLDPQFPERQLCGWLQQQFTLETDPTTFQGLPADEAISLIGTKLEELYRLKEVQFPVAVGLNRFMNDAGGSAAGSGSARVELINWASDRFGRQIDQEAFRGQSRAEIEAELNTYSRACLPEADVAARIDETLDQIWPDLSEAEAGQSNGDARKGPVYLQQATPELATRLSDWTRNDLKCEVSADDLTGLSRTAAKQLIHSAWDRRYRPELSHAERALLLEILDVAWKEHLYYMDQLRDGINLVGYAQKDPKVEYKREGRKAFQQMWNRVAEQVSGAIFRMDKESPEFVGSLWQITGTRHDAVNAGGDFPDEVQESSGSNDRDPGQEPAAVDPIVNSVPKVGRNDLCPCGSGKKYKKCHGQVG
ncbi:MAG: preprotein translocase subunit SecA [Planctomycetaceae bacterium]|nr:preprotein translocase subunit SecA [Planctomycetaceae bacterium]